MIFYPPQVRLWMMTRVLLNPPLRLLIPLVGLCLRALGGSILALLWFLLPLEPIVVCLKCCKTDHLYTLRLLSCSFPKFRPTFGVLYSAITWEGAFRFYTDRQVIGIAHGVFCTAALLASFGYDLHPLLWSGLQVPWALILLLSSCSQCSFLALVFSIGSFSYLSSCPFWCPLMSCSVFVTRSFVYILGVFKLFIWYARNALAFAMFVLDLPQSSTMLKLVLALIFLCIPKVCIFKQKSICCPGLSRSSTSPAWP